MLLCWGKIVNYCPIPFLRPLTIANGKFQLTKPEVVFFVLFCFDFCLNLFSSEAVGWLGILH